MCGVAKTVKNVTAWASLVALTLCVSVCAAEQKPVSEDQMKAALAAGQRARESVKIAGALLPASALIVKSGGVRCGHAIIRVDATTEGGAAYKMVENFKAATAEEGQTALVDYTGTFLLDGNLGLISGAMQTKQELRDLSKNKTQNSTLLATMVVKNKILTWKRQELDEQGKEVNATATHQIELKNVNPLPRNALTALSRIMLANGALKLETPDKTPAICVPCVDLDFEMNDLVLDAGWLTFDKPTYVNPKDSAYVMRARYFGADVTDDGLDIETPTAIMWVAHQSWAFAADGRIVQHPNPDRHVSVETVDAATLDVNTPLDFDAIRKAADKSQK